MVKKRYVEESSTDSEHYEVEAIRRARTTINKKWEYSIKWRGYPESDNSWEPEVHLDGCTVLLKDFWNRVGIRKKAQAASLPYGFEVIISKDETEDHGGKVQTQPTKQGTQIEKVREKTNLTRSTPVNATTDSEEAVEELVVNKQPENANSEEKVIPSPIEISSGNATSVDDSPLGVTNEDNNSDLDDIPLSQLQAVQTPQVMKRKRSDEDFGKTESAKRPSPSRTVDDKSQHISSTNVEPGLSNGGVEANLPAHIRRKRFPKIKEIDVSNTYQAISTKSRVAKMGQRTTSITTASPVPQSPGSPSVSISADQWLSSNFQSPIGSLQVTHNPSQTLPSFGKRWKWTGQLCVGDNESDDGFADLIGNVKMLDNVSGEARANDLTMGLLLPSSIDSLCFRHTYSLATLDTALSDFRIAHFARMTTDTSQTNASESSTTDSRIDEENLFASLVTFMKKNALYSCMPLTMQNTRVATMFILPALEDIWDTIKLPEKLRQLDTIHTLVVAIGIPIYEPQKGPGETGACEDIDIPRKTKDYGLSSSYLFSFPDFGRAVLRLEFPELLFKRLNHRKYTIFMGHSSTSAQAQGLLDPEDDPDTKALNMVMKAVPGAEKLPLYEGEARAVFIHVGAWRMLHKLLGLVDRRLRRPDVQFFTYGTDPTVERRFWGVQEVFPIGGLVTLTSGAVLEDPESVLKLVGKIFEHSLWNCYIHPAVISMLVKLLKGAGTVETDVDKLYNTLRSLTGILRAIEKKQLEVMWHPPAPHQWRASVPSSSSSPPEGLELKKASWIFQQGRMSSLRGSEFTEECERWFPAANRTEKDVENLLVDDMIVMQSEFRKEFRRFVIITDTGRTSNTSKDAANVSASTYTVRDMFEFTNVKDFKFGDEKLN